MGSSAPALSLHLRQRRFRLGEPERHIYGTIQHNGRGELGASLLLLADRGIQRAETSVAVGHERTHAQCVGQGEGLAVVSSSRLAIMGIAVPGDVAEDVQGRGTVRAAACHETDLW